VKGKGINVNAWNNTCNYNIFNVEMVKVVRGDD